MCKISKRARSTLSESDVILPVGSTPRLNETINASTQRLVRSFSCPYTKDEFNTGLAHLILNDIGKKQNENKNSRTSNSEKTEIQQRKDIEFKTTRIHNMRTILTIIYELCRNFGKLSKFNIKMEDFPKIQNSVSKMYNKNKNGLAFLFQLQRHPSPKVSTCPVSLSTYFDSLTSGNSMSQDESMSNNLLRMSSYSSFPRHVNIFTSLLSKAGFYYTGHDDEVRCYSCGLTHKHWKSGDDPLFIHKRMSPFCSHVISMNTTIRSMNRNDHNSLNHSSSHSRSQDFSSATNVSSHNQVVSESREITNSLSNVAAETDRQSSLQSEINASFQNGATGFAENIDVNEGLQSSLGIEVDKPRYPNYAPLPVRISSFQGWPSYLDQTPREMASAGFLYAGYQDYTRCFFCGGGLRNWEAGDDPWIEHARWFPKCTFLKQNKGERFIRAVQEKQKQFDKEKNSTAQSTILSQNPSPTKTDQPTNLLNSVAAKSVIEMGYSREEVLKAIHKLKLTRADVNGVSARAIMSILLNDHDDEDRKGSDSGLAPTSMQNTEVAHEQSNTSSERVEGRIDSMMDDVEQLVEENRQLKDLRLCKVCLDFDASIAFLPCGHIVCCPDCAPAMRKCPMCRTHVKGTVKTFLI